MGASGDGRRDDMGLVHLGMLALLVGLIVLIWYLEHKAIAYNGLKWAWFQLWVFDWNFLPSWARDIRIHAAGLASNPGQVSFLQLVDVLNQAGYFFIWIPLYLTYRGVRAAMSHPSNKTRRKVTVDTLPWIVSKHSPAVIPTLYYGDLLNEDPEEHRSSLNPEEWVERHGVLINGRLDRDRCRALLIQDLGKPINSLNDLLPHEKALFAVFGSRIFFNGRDRKKAQELLDDLNWSCHQGTFEGKKGYPDLSLADKAFKKYSSSPDAKDWVTKHRYARTLLHAMHKKAMETGKVPSSHFRWLKGMDRGLWLALNTTGRKGPFQESSAVFTQALWEEFVHDIGYHLVDPYVDDAIDGLEKYLIKIGLIAPTNSEA